MGRLWAFLTSRTVAVALLSIVLGLLIIGSLLPAPQFMSLEDIETAINEYPLLFKLGERFNSQKMAQGYLFGIIGVFLIVSTAMCSIDRMVAYFRAAGPSGQETSFPPVEEESNCLMADVPGMQAADIHQLALGWLKRGRYMVSEGRGEDGSITLAGTRGRVGFWGSVLFHLVLISSLAGIVMYYLGGFHGTLVFVEGQSYELSPERFRYIRKEPLLGLRLPRVELGLINQYSVYAPNEPRYPLEYVARFRVMDLERDTSRDVDVRINNPLVINGRDFLLTKGGFTPLLVIKKANGGTVLDSYISLYDQAGTSDSVTLREESMDVLINLYPNYIMENGEHGTRGIELKNPFARLRVVRKGSLLYEGVIPKGGETVEAGGYSFGFVDVKRWVILELVDEPGIGMFFILSFFGLAGLAVRMLDPDERIYVGLRQAGAGVHIRILPLSRHFSGIAMEKARAFMDSLASNRMGDDSV